MSCEYYDGSCEDCTRIYCPDTVQKIGYKRDELMDEITNYYVCIHKIEEELDLLVTEHKGALIDYDK